MWKDEKRENALLVKARTGQSFNAFCNVWRYPVCTYSIKK